MPHDKNGIEVKAGDVVKFRVEGFIAHDCIGAVTSVCKGSDTCNLTVDYIGKRVQSESFEGLPELMRGQSVTARECERLA